MKQFSISTPGLISSAANPEVKFLRALHERKYRKKSGWFLAEGTRICREAVALGWKMHRLAFLAGRENDPELRPLMDGLTESDGRALPMTEALLQRIAHKDNPQILLGAFGQRWHDLHAVLSAPDKIWIALDRVRDPGNLGTVMRTIDAVDAAGIILIGNCTDPYSVEAVRASMGALFSVKLVVCNELDFINFSIVWPGRIIGTALTDALDYRACDYHGRLIMLMGNEQAGLSEALMQVCDQRIKIPMLGRSDSLNLAVAVGVALYQAMDKRGINAGK